MEGKQVPKHMQNDTHIASSSEGLSCWETRRRVTRFNESVLLGDLSSQGERSLTTWKVRLHQRASKGGI